ncbi:HNH endonuclease [Undibacterium pigrum]|uniref:HNH endonuclease n=2 Tax=Undibacterium pigrum TaxID=401470 RepID=A0A318IXP5_9BURK|nr:HNH endonuclease [Undibacterium pigrum]
MKMPPVLFGILAFIVLIMKDTIVAMAQPVGILIAVIFGVLVLYQVYSFSYFSGEKFKKLKKSIEEYTKNCNELNHHIQELKNAYVDVTSQDYGHSTLQDGSNYNFKRTEWNKSIKNNYVHNCSLSVCKNANDQPFKYLCKYFDIKANEEALSNFEAVLNDFAAAEQGKLLVKAERDLIITNLKTSIPSLIFSFSKKRLIKELGFEEIDLSDLYFPIYTFQYVSAGGNSSSKCDIKMDVNNLDRFIDYLSSLIKFRNSVAGQRALMTSRLRESIKERDNHTCRTCGISAHNEKHLLLEIDHIIPLSKGGITSENNLQTLCWKCNRSKGSKLV